jgi:hypothetical protein
MQGTRQNITFFDDFSPNGTIIFIEQLYHGFTILKNEPTIINKTNSALNKYILMELLY